MTVEVIVDFCGECGILLRPHHESHRREDTLLECENCGHDVTSRQNRIQGMFTHEEAKKLYATNGEEV